MSWLAISDTRLYADVGGLCEYELQNMPVAELHEPANASRILTDVITVRGTATDMRFDSYVLDFQYTSGDGHWEQIAVGNSEVMDGVLGQWHTNTLVHGFYTLRLRTFTVDGFVAVAECVVSKGQLTRASGKCKLYSTTSAKAGDMRNCVAEPIDLVPLNVPDVSVSCHSASATLRNQKNQTVCRAEMTLKIRVYLGNGRMDS